MSHAPESLKDLERECMEHPNNPGLQAELHRALNDRGHHDIVQRRIESGYVIVDILTVMSFRLAVVGMHSLFCL